MQPYSGKFHLLKTKKVKWYTFKDLLKKGQAGPVTCSGVIY